MSLAADHPGSPDLARLQTRALAAGAAGLAVCALGAAFGLAHFLRAYLVAYQFWLGVGLGCLVLLMLQYLTGGAWGVVLRRPLEAGARTLPLLAVLFLPLALGLGHLYPWTHETLHNSWWLNVPWFLVRAALYCAAWLGVSHFLNRWSERQDAGPDRVLLHHFQALSAPGLLLYGLTVTFAAIDWAMSLEPHWYSTIYPVIFAVGQVLAGLAFAVAVVLLLRDTPPLAELLRPAHLNDLGNLLLAFVMVWAYVSVSQFLLIWSGNLPEENVWYLRRSEGGWQAVAAVLVALHFGLPFLLLLSREVKRNPRGLAVVTGVVLAMRFLDVFWWIEPAFEGGPFLYGLLDLAALVGLGGVWLWWFLWQLGKRPLLPLHDPALAEATHHE